MESIGKRRRFQPPTTKLFDSHSDNETPQFLPSSSPSSLFSSPDSTEASLLTVGCRIRKSVPEGYKTPNTTSSGFTPRPFMSSRLSPQTLAAINAPAAFSELTPYSSSINDIGGLPSQPLATATYCGIGLHNMPSGSTTSLSSTPSSSQEAANKHKRAFDDACTSDEDDDVNADFIPQLPPSVFTGFTPAPYSSGHSTSFASSHRRGSSYPFKHTTMPDLNMLSTARAFAQPKSRMSIKPRPTAQTGSVFRMEAEQENRRQDSPNFFWGFSPSCAQEMSMETSSNNDFGDAGFLRRRDEVEMDCS